MSNNFIVTLQDVTKLYHTTLVTVSALNGIFITIAEGEFISIMGQSGSGKSTLLNLIGCLTSPTNGKYFLGSDDISQVTRKQLAEIRNRKIGFVFQQFNLLPRFTALANVEIPLIYAGYPPAQRKEMASDALASLGLEKRMHHKPTQLSGGEQQRVAIARALICNPKLILADEPTGNLDSQSGKEVMEILKDINLKGTTILMVTHDASNAAYGNRLIRLKDGKVIAA